MNVGHKPLCWIGSSLADVRQFPEVACRRAGYELRRVQAGLSPSDFKPMKSVGPGVHEIRIHTELEHRILYVARFNKAIYVLHAFEKKSRQTPLRDLEIARRRLTEIYQRRQAR